MQTLKLLQGGLGAFVLLWLTEIVEARRSMSELPNKDTVVAEGDSNSSGRGLLQIGYYDNNCDYYGNCGNYWSGGRIAGVVIGCVAFVCGVIFLILALLMRRRRMARYQMNNPGAYPVGPPMGTYPNQGPQGPNGMYPQANTYPNQAYPQNMGTYNPAPAYPVTGPPTNGFSGVQMQTLPQEKPGYEKPGYETSSV